MKNPYEESKSIEFPDDFLVDEKKPTLSRADLHNVPKNDVDELNKDIAKILNNNEEKDQTFNFDLSGDDEEEDKNLQTIFKEPTKIEPKIKIKSGKKGYLLIGLTCATIIFLILSIVLLFSVNGLKAELASINEKYENLAEQNLIYETKISELEAELKDKNIDVSGNGSYYVVTSTRIRTGAGTTYDKVAYSSLPSAVQAYAEGDGEAVTKVGVTIPTINVVTSDGSVWGEIAEGYWFCISSGSDVYAKIQ